jgi:hypothetical protein
MAQYEDFSPPPGASPAQIYTQITSLLTGAYSVEVLPQGTSVILRVWYAQHCDPASHTRI